MVTVSVSSDLSEEQLFKVLHEKKYEVERSISLTALNILSIIQLKVTDDSLPKLHKL